MGKTVKGGKFKFLELQMRSLPGSRSTFYQTPPSLWNLDLKHIDFCWLTCCALYFRFSFLIPIQLAPEIFLLPFTAIVLQLLECLFLSYLILNAKYLV